MLSEKKYNEKIGFLLGEKYRLELHWSKIKYNKGICSCSGAYFSGPALQFAERIEPNNFLLLDLYKQYFMYTKTVYIVNFSWGGVEYANDGRIIKLSDVFLKHDIELNKVPKLKNKDYIVINTKGHDRATHYLHPTYDGVVVNELGEAYNFWTTDGRFRKV